MPTLQCGHVTRASFTPDALDPPGSCISRNRFCLCPTFHVESALCSSASVGGRGHRRTSGGAKNENKNVTANTRQAQERCTQKAGENIIKAVAAHRHPRYYHQLLSP